jgi:DNA-binding MarR family transcriptional regulator
MSLERTLQIVQMAYPRIYLACHTRHQRKRSTSFHLSARDASILAHLDTQLPTPPARLASHLNVARSTMSEALTKLTALGYTRQTARTAESGRRGGIGVLLTARGAAAIRETSVLEAPRLRAVLKRLTPTELRAVERGLGALAGACTSRASAPTFSSQSDP